MVRETAPLLHLVAYERVSTARQGRSGLGLEAQRRSIESFVAARNASLIGRFTEVESGRRNDRPELAKALQMARLTGATLVIAKLDRLSRNAAFLLTLRDSGVHFVAADMPEANDLKAGPAQQPESLTRRAIWSYRTKAPRQTPATWRARLPRRRSRPRWSAFAPPHGRKLRRR